MDEELKPKYNIIDNAYFETKKKYGYSDKEACFALEQALIENKLNYITSTNNARQELIGMPYADYFYLASTYALASYSIKGKKNLAKEKELNQYAIDFDGKLKYKDKKSLELFVTALTINPFYALNLFAINSKIKESIIKQMIQERYASNKSKELEEQKFYFILKSGNNNYTISNNTLAKACAEMKKQELEEQKEYNLNVKSR